MALLAALPKAPSNYDPQENMKRSKSEGLGLERMSENGVITEIVAQIMQDSKLIMLIGFI